MCNVMVALEFPIDLAVVSLTFKIFSRLYL